MRDQNERRRLALSTWPIDMPQPRQIKKIIDEESELTDVGAEAFIRKFVAKGKEWFKKLLGYLQNLGETDLIYQIRQAMRLPAYHLASVVTAKVSSDNVRSLIQGAPDRIMIVYTDTDDVDLVPVSRLRDYSIHNGREYRVITDAFSEQATFTYEGKKRSTDEYEQLAEEINRTLRRKARRFM